MAGIEISVRAEDPEMRSRVVDLTLHGKEVVTPVRSLCLTQPQTSEAKTLRQNDGIMSIIEVPRDIDKKKLEEIDGDREKQEIFYRQIRYRFTDLGLGDWPTIFAYTYNNKGSNLEKNTQPTNTEVEYLCDLLNHPFNDLWVPPVVPKLSGQAYLPYLAEFYKRTKSYSQVRSAGLIPHIARLELRLLAEFYIKQGTNYFVMDFAGKNPLDLVGNINQVIKMVGVIEKEYRQPCFLHAMNVPFTKSHWKNRVIPAKDILLFEMGFNCFGSSHIRRQLPKEFLEKVSLVRPHYRLFNRKDYGYYRDDTDNLTEMLAEDERTITSCTDFKEGLAWGEVRTREKLFNVERHCLEANEIRKRIIGAEGLSGYLQEKRQLNPKYVRQVMKVGKK